MKKFQIFVILLSFSLIHSSSGVLLSGMMLTYLARGLLSSMMDNTVKTVYTTTMPMSDSSITTLGQSSGSMDTMNTISQVVRALGIGRTIKDLFAEDQSEEEDDCKGRKCKKGKNKKRKKKRSDSSEEDDGVKPLFADTEDYSRYIIHGKRDDPEEIANDLLSEDDPMNFYYVIKDTQKRHKKEKQVKRRTPRPEGMSGDKNVRQSKNPPNRDRSPQQRHPPVPPPASDSAQQIPMFRRGKFPIFIRYRKRTPGSSYGLKNFLPSFL